MKKTVFLGLLLISINSFSQRLIQTNVKFREFIQKVYVTDDLKDVNGMITTQLKDGDVFETVLLFKKNVKLEKVFEYLSIFPGYNKKLLAITNKSDDEIILKDSYYVINIIAENDSFTMVVAIENHKAYKLYRSLVNYTKKD